jgi:hypothetical protein
MSIHKCVNIHLNGAQNLPVLLVNYVGISPSNWCNAQWHKCKVNGTKYAVLFDKNLHQNFTAYFRLQLLHQAPYFGAILPKAVDIKSILNYLHKSCAVLAAKILEKFTIWFEVCLIGK